MKPELKPQVGGQTDFLASPAFLTIYGGAAGSGKSWVGLYEFIRNVKTPGFAGVAFRRHAEDITKPGSLWDTSCELYPLVGGYGTKSDLRWVFPSGASMVFAGMKDEKDRLKWQSSQMPYMFFDEATHFSPIQFFYMFSRNRSTTGIPGRIRCGCNPDPDSFIRELIDWWIGKDGFPIKERSGKLRWFIRRGYNLEWADTRQELIAKFGADQEPKSLTFIPSSIYDNKILLEKDPGYLSNLKALSQVDRMQLLEGNWNVRMTTGSYFKREWFKKVQAVPAAGIVSRIRFYDRAATEKTDHNDPDQTVSVKMAKAGDGRFYIEDVTRMFASPYDVEREMLRLAEQDGKECTIGWMRDPGGAGVKESQDTAFKLSGWPLFILEGSDAQKSKEIRCKAISSQLQAGNVAIVEGEWNAPYFRNLEGFPDGRYKDDADATSGAHAGLDAGPAATPLTSRPHDFGMGMTQRFAI